MRNDVKSSGDVRKNVVSSVWSIVSLDDSAVNTNS